MIIGLVEDHLVISWGLPIDISSLLGHSQLNVVVSITSLPARPAPAVVPRARVGPVAVLGVPVGLRPREAVLRACFDASLRDVLLADDPLDLVVSRAGRRIRHALNDLLLRPLEAAGDHHGLPLLATVALGVDLRGEIHLVVVLVLLLYLLRGSSVVLARGTLEATNGPQVVILIESLEGHETS